MQVILFALFIAIFSLDYMARIAGVIHPAVSLVPELLSAVAAVLVVGRLVSTKRFDAHIKYLLFFFLFGLHIVNGIIINEVPSGSVVAGLRIYLKYVPFFFVPIVYPLTARQMKVLFGLLALILVAQLPLSLVQRFIWFPDRATGDVVRGSLETGAFQSIVLVSAIAVCLGMYLKKVISGGTFGVLMALLFLPTTMNETKGTLILFPVACAVPLLLMEGRKLSRFVVMMAGIGTCAFLAFSVIFTYTQSRFVGHTDDIMEFFERDRLTHYLAPQTAQLDISEDRYGRIDVLFVALEDITARPMTALVGFGMGSATKAPIESFSGPLASHYYEMGVLETAVPYILLETGLLGVMLWIAFFGMLFRDAWIVSRRDDGLLGGLALGWLGVIPVILIAYFYKQIVPVNAIMYVFWFLSGAIIAARYRLETTGRAYPVGFVDRSRMRQSADAEWVPPLLR
jgi:hypothetical protein